MEPIARTPTCPACGAALESTLACLACGRVLIESEQADHYSRLGLPASVDVDADRMETQYLRLSRALHPDFHGASDDATRALANHNSALLNEARRVLADEQERGEYLLGRIDAGALERAKTLAPAFLMQAMDLSEAVEGASGSDADALARLAEGIRQEIAARAAVLSDTAAWSTLDTQRLATLLHEQRVLRRILRDAESTQ